MERPKKKSEWEGLLVRTNCKLSTKGGNVFPAGTKMLVTRNYGGLHLQAVEQCAKCKSLHRHIINKVSENHVTIIGRSKPYSDIDDNL